MNASEAAALFERLSSLLSMVSMPSSDRSMKDIEDDLFNRINSACYRDWLNYAWKSHSSKPPYNPWLGVRKIPLVAGFELEASIGLEQDGFEKPCCIIALVRSNKG